MSDLDIIAQLEQQIGKKLKKLRKIKWNSVGYQLNARQQVIGLGLYECELKELSKEISQLQQLQTLYLCGNEITQLSKEIGQLQQLQWLDLSGNPFQIPPVEIVKKGKQAIIDYYEELEIFNKNMILRNKD